MRWSEVLTDKSLTNLPYKIELDEWGNIVMSPASNRHAFLQMTIALWLNGFKEQGIVFQECSVQTEKGVKVADVVWGSARFFARHQLATPYLLAPELCVEVLSPSNSMAEMREKKELYFAKGAKEFWVCDDTGQMIFFAPLGELERSELFPTFPRQLELHLPDPESDPG